MTVAATGHRPNKLGGYSAQTFMRLITFAESEIVRVRAGRVITGMAIGWDMAVAYAAYTYRIPYVAAVPFVGQQDKWPEVNQGHYEFLLRHADKVEIICEGAYQPWKMQRRNEWMVDNCNKMLALWDGSAGGTANCIKYAEKKHREIDNAWERWQRYNQLPQRSTSN